MEKDLGALENEILHVNGVPYRTLKLLGKGKGGYSYLARCEADAVRTERDCGGLVVLKQIHHEPCDYYTFGNKIEAERRDYERLVAAGIRVPQLIDIDEEKERIVKQFIDGRTVAELVKEGSLPPEIMAEGKKMAELAKSAGLNIDYYPTNFVPDESGALYYVDYECNAYMDEWSFDNWGKKFWIEFP